MNDFLDPESGTLVRKRDEEGEFGVPSGYNNYYNQLSGEEEKANDRSMALLREALNNANEITPTQGIAAALLAAIPTFGGYLIGNSVGDLNLPNGGIGVDIAKLQTGGAAGGLAGAQAGLDASGSYLKSLDKEKENDAILLRMAEVESQKANREGNKAAQVMSSGLAAKERRDVILDPELQAAEIEMTRKKADETNISRQKYPTPSESDAARPVSQEQREYFAKQFGVDPQLVNTYGDVDRLTRVMKEEGINNRMSTKLDRQDAMLTVPGTKLMEGAVADPKAVPKVREAMVNYNQITQIVVPELRRVFTDPKATVDQQESALANAIITIKNQQGMGANFTLLEERLVKAGLPNIFNLSFTDSLNALRATLQGQEPLQKIARLEEISKLGTESILKPYNHILDTGASAAGGLPSVGGTFLTPEGTQKKVLRVTRKS